MATVTVEWGESQQLVARAREHQVVLDRSASGTGWRSGELLLMALGACTAGTLMNHATVREMPIRSLKVELQSERLHAPSRYGDIQVTLTIEGDLTEAQRALILRVAQACTIHNTLRHPPNIAVAFAAPESAAATSYTAAAAPEARPPDG